jgi:stress response protein SCP2
MTLDLSKPSAPLVNDSGTPVQQLQVEFSWQEPQTSGLKGLFGKGKVNVDAACIYYAYGEPSGYANPDNLKVLSGRVRHHGDVKKGSGEGAGEVITIDLAGIRAEDSDVDAFALTASCKKGDFNGVAEAYCRIFDISGGQPVHLGNVRVPIQGTHTGVVIGVIKKSTSGWTFTRLQGVRGPARTWQELGALAQEQIAALR